MYFEYRRFENHLGPYLTVSLDGAPFTAMIDSGADVTLIPKYVAAPLGLLQGSQRTVVGVAGSGAAILSFVLVAVPNISHKPLRIPCLIVDQDIPILLGRAGFFDAFDIVFHQKGGVFAVEEAL